MSRKFEEDPNAPNFIKRKSIVEPVFSCCDQQALLQEHQSELAFTTPKNSEERRASERAVQAIRRYSSRPYKHVQPNLLQSRRKEEHGLAFFESGKQSAGGEGEWSQSNVFNPFQKPRGSKYS